MTSHMLSNELIFNMNHNFNTYPNEYEILLYLGNLNEKSKFDSITSDKDFWTNSLLKFLTNSLLLDIT